jgi:hypothetical protein
MLMRETESNDALRLSFDNLKAKVIDHIVRPVKTEADMLRFLRAWFCRQYNRPYKDPLLLEYTFEDLLVEYLDVHYRSNPKALEKESPEGKRVEASDDKWAERMMREATSESASSDRAAKQAAYRRKMKEEGFEFQAPPEKPESEIEQEMLEKHLKFGDG